MHYFEPPTPFLHFLFPFVTIYFLRVLCYNSALTEAYAEWQRLGAPVEFSTSLIFTFKNAVCIIRVSTPTHSEKQKRILLKPVKDKYLGGAGAVVCKVSDIKKFGKPGSRP